MTTAVATRRSLSDRQRSPLRFGLDRLLDDVSVLASRRYGLLCHQASLTVDHRPAHLALVEAGAPPTVLFGPEHGFYGVEQDMKASLDERDPWTGVPVVSLYGEAEHTLRPRPESFSDLDLLVIDLQDVGARYYTFAATAIWAAEVALESGCEVWILDRPNPLGGERVEGNLLEPGYESFVGAFRLPVRHGLTLGELASLEARRRGWDAAGLRVSEVGGWHRRDDWPATGRSFVAPSPNMPTLDTAVLYPGLCLIEATELSEGRGTTRPFQLVGAPYVDPPAVSDALGSLDLPGVSFLPTYFKPQFQKHAGTVCGGVEIVVRDREIVEPFRLGVELLALLKRLYPDDFEWRRDPYEFVAELPAIDLLAGSDQLRRRLDSGADLDSWIASWGADTRSFLSERQEILLYE